MAKTTKTPKRAPIKVSKNPKSPLGKLGPYFGGVVRDPALFPNSPNS